MKDSPAHTLKKRLALKHQMAPFRLFILCIFLWSILPVSHGQVPEDSLTVNGPVNREKKGSIFNGRPGKSMLMSLIVPGTGQIYNKSYLRVPFVWAAVGGMGYVLHYNTREYTVRRDAYKAIIDGVPYQAPSWYKDADLLESITNPAQLRTLRDEANANRQLTIIVFSLVWLANGIDAFVDAHLKEFDMDENISVHIRPALDNDAFAPMRVGMFVSLK